MSFCGLFIGGASNMIGAACAADLGKEKVINYLSSSNSIQRIPRFLYFIMCLTINLWKKTAVEYGMPSAVSMVTGFIDGTGSLGAAVGQVTIPYLELYYGWGSVFFMFMVSKNYFLKFQQNFNSEVFP